MKSILLTTTAIVAFAGAAAADGHISMSWSGTATAGVAREGGTDATGQATAALIDILIAGDAAADETAAAAALVGAGAAYLDAINTTLDSEFGTGFTAVAGAEPTAAEIAATRAALATALELVNSDFSIGESAADLKAAKALIGATSATMDAVYGTLATDTDEFEMYAEVNATVTGSVATDNGLTLSASMSVDAGRGYDFADDDGFDSAKTNGVGFDNVTLDAGTFGTLKFAPDDIAHLVDGDDDAAADVLYTNDFGIAKFSFALDIDTDDDAEASAASWELLTAAEGADATGVPTILGAALNSTSQPLDLWYN
ncbi:hypothetical protein N9876_01160, partial [bacterium]|nr:hypothetical protein [bacterium]